MHQVIRAIVEAATPEDALDNARVTFENLTGNDGHVQVFNSYTMFDEDGSGISGKDRYGDVPAVLDIDTPAGSKMVLEGWDATRKEFYKNLKDIKAMLRKYKRAELFEMRDELGSEIDINLTLFKHHLYKAGQYNGSAIWLYDRYGEGIQSARDLESAVKLEDPTKKMWVVPADVHY